MSGFLPLLALAFTSFHWSEVLEERQIWKTENGLPQNTVHALLQDSQGYLWVGTEGGVARFDGVRFQVFNTETYPEMGSNDVRALCSGADGAVWVATAAGVLMINGAQLRAFGAGSGLPGTTALSVEHDPKGRIVAVTSAGKSIWDGQRFRPTQEDLISLPKTEPKLPLPADDPLRRAGILCQLRDREGDLWLGTEWQGLVVLRRPKFSVLGMRQGLAGETARCVYQARNGTVWIGTGESGLTAYRDGELRTYTVKDGLTSDVVIALGESGNGDLLVGTPDGLNRLHAGKWTAVTSADGLADDFIRSLACGRDGEIFAGTRHGLTVIEGGHYRTVTQADGLGSDLVGAILPSRLQPGVVWVATSRGVSRLGVDGRVTPAAVDAKLRGEVVTALYEDAAGRLWVGSQGGSLAMIVNGRLSQFDGLKGLPKLIFGIAEDTNGNLWLTSNTGAYRVKRADLLANVGEAVAYGTADGLRVNDCSAGGHPSIWRATDGAIWFATPRGVARMSTEQAQLNTVPPDVAVETVRVDDRNTDSAQNGAGLGEIRVGPGHNRYAFEFAGLSFAVPQKVRYRYRLVGFDSGWIDAGTRRIAYYTNLPPGRFRFAVIASNNDGVWSTSPAQILIIVEPHVYQTWWFAALCGLTTVLLVYGIYRWRFQQVQIRYRAVLDERGRIAREIHDTLAQGFAGVSVQLEIVSRLLKEGDGEAREFLNQARTLVRESLGEARRAIWQLRNDADAAGDLRSRLAQLSQPETPGEPRVMVVVQGAFRPLPPQTENELVRITQEAVRNARQHAAASEIEVSLRFVGETVQLVIRDDGRGFSSEAAGAMTDHFGLRGMRERAAAIGGNLSIKTSPGEGTSVLVEIAG